MPDPIRVPVAVVVNRRERLAALVAARGREASVGAREARNRQIRKWAREEKPYQWICAQVGLRDRQVREIINGGGAS